MSSRSRLVGHPSPEPPEGGAAGEEGVGVGHAGVEEGVGVGVGVGDGSSQVGVGEEPQGAAEAVPARATRARSWVNERILGWR